MSVLEFNMSQNYSGGLMKAKGAKHAVKSQGIS